MRTNTARTMPDLRTHEGAKAYLHMTPEQTLRRHVMSCLLWESEFYSDGQSIADRIEESASAVAAEVLAQIAVEARTEQNLRHVPLLLLCALAKRGGSIVGQTLPQVIQRADELSEFMALYWRAGKTPLSKQVKIGLAAAFQRFDAYQLAKYDRQNGVRLRDVLFMVHAKPKDEAQADIWKQLIDGALPSPDTWEVALSAGGDKREEFTRLLSEGKLGYLALLRNLRNMVESGVDEALIRDAILARKGGAEKVLPFRYVAAARACPRLESSIDQALSDAIASLPILPGRTAVLVDVSGSMDAKLSAKSDMTRMDAACALASLIHGDVRMFSFSNQVVEVPARRGMAGVDALMRSQPHGGTALFEAVHAINQKVPYDRIIVITDEQAGSFSRIGSMPDPMATGYLINVASNKNGVGYGKWRHIDGWSENVIRWITGIENDA